MRLLFFIFMLSVSILPLLAEEPEIDGYYTQDGVLKKNGHLGPSDIAVSPNGKFLFVLESDAWQVRKTRPDGQEKPIVLPLDFRPERMKLYASGTKLVVIGGGVRGKLVLIDAITMKILSMNALGHSPSDVSVFADENSQTAYVSNRFEGTISVIDLLAGKEITRWKAGREPIALQIGPKGKKLLIANHLPEGTSLDPFVGCNARIIDTETGTAKIVHLRGGTINARDAIISPDGKFGFITAQVGHFEQIPTNVDGGWMNENIISIVDMEKEEYKDSLFLDDFAFGAANPWGMAISTDSRFLAVAMAGSCEIIYVNLSTLMKFLSTEPYFKVLGQATGYHDRLDENDLPMRLRVPFGLKGIRHLAFDGHRIYANAYFEDTIVSCGPEISLPVTYMPGYIDPKVHEIPKRLEAPFDVKGNEPLRFEQLKPLRLMKGVDFDRKLARLGPSPVMDIVRKGEMIFHDASRCYEKWQSCISCHPDGRSDTLNWDLINDGMNNPKNTKSMLLSHETPPAMVTGVRADAETAVRSGVKSILFATVIEEDALAMDEYLKSLRAVPSPYLVNGELSESAKRGKRIFNSSRSGCADCHPKPLFTDLTLHDVGTRNLVDHHSKFDTPTLVEIWRTAPYLHDGRYKTIKELIVDGKHYNNHGQLDKLSEQEIDDLVEYVLSL